MMEREAAAGAKLAPITSGVSQEIDPVAAADEFYRDVWRPGIDTALFEWPTVTQAATAA